jgi:hypothetical protein
VGKLAFYQGEPMSAGEVHPLGSWTHLGYILGHPTRSSGRPASSTPQVFCLIRACFEVALAGIYKPACQLGGDIPRARVQWYK